MKFKLKSDFSPTGDQPQAIEKLVAGIGQGMKHQTLLGVTGSGKSLAFNEPIFLIRKDKKSSVPQLVPIGKLINDLFLDYQTQKNKDSEFLLASKIKPKFKTLSLNPRTGKHEIKSINKFIRHQANQNNFLLKTACGREIEVTGDHNFWVLRNGNFRLVRTEEITREDYLPTPIRISLSNDKKDLPGLWLNNWINEKVYFKLTDIPAKKLKNKRIIKKVLGAGKFQAVFNTGERVEINYLPKISQNCHSLKKLTVCRKNGKNITLYQWLKVMARKSIS